MITIKNHHVFKGHKTLLGSKYVTYAEVELPTRNDIFGKANTGFDWGYHGSATIQLAFSMLYQLSNEQIARKHASKFSTDVIQTLTSRDWILRSSDVVEWINNHLDEEDKTLLNPKDEQNIQTNIASTQKARVIPKRKKKENNVVKEVCKELGITQKTLAEILEVPEGTVSSWAVKNEIPRLGKKAIDFYIQNKRNQEIVDSYKNFRQLLENA